MDDVIEELPVVEDTAEKQAKPKSFTQEDVNSLLQTRLAKQSKLHEAEVGLLQVDKDFYEKVVKQTLATQLADFDPTIKLLVEKLPLKEQMEYLANPDVQKTLKRVDIPPLPNGITSNSVVTPSIIERFM